MSDDLKRMCRNLPLKEQVELREFLTREIASAKGKWITKSQFRCSILFRDVGIVMGKDRISYDSRAKADVWARTMVAYQMILEGYTTLEIGVQMGKDHSSVTWMKKKMQDVFDMPVAYRDILEIWDKFQERIQL